MTATHEFPGPAWLKMLERAWRSYAPKLQPGTKLSISETYTNVPQHLAGNERGEVSWTCRVDSPNVQFFAAAAADVDLRVEAEYGFVKDMVRFVVLAENEHDYQRLAAAALSGGKLTVTGDMTIASLAQDLHNDVAEQTR
jgi:hypothetical protein